MLVQFSFDNYKCFKETTTLNLTTSLQKSKQFYSYATHFGYRVLKTIAVYGANASGKTKLFDAFKFFKLVLFSSKDSDGNLFWQKEYDNFRFSTLSGAKGSGFEVVFILDGIQYRYGFVLNRQRIETEYLYRKQTKEVYVFERTVDGIKCNPKYGEKGELLIKGDMVRDEMPFLSALYEWKDDIATELMGWLRKTIVISNNELPMPSPHYLEDDNFKRLILAFLKKFDISIEDISMHEIAVNDIPDKIKMFLGKDNLGGTFYDGVSTSHKLYNEHYKVVSKSALQMEKDESFGTNRLFRLCVPLLSALSRSSVIFIDEFDSGIHPNILSELISMFYSLGVKGAQLVVNTHNTSLLSRNLRNDALNIAGNQEVEVAKPRKLFIKDQIYFVSKNRYGESSLVALTDFKDTRSNLENLYLEGLLDGVPNIDYENTDTLIAESNVIGQR